MSKQTIHKYKLEITDVQHIEIPSHSEILCVQNQNGWPHVWVKCDPEFEPSKRTIYIHGTGHEVINPSAKYIGTFQLQDGALVFHVFAGNG